MISTIYHAACAAKGTTCCLVLARYSPAEACCGARCHGCALPLCDHRVHPLCCVVCCSELHKRVSAFMLRRTQEVLSKHLPPLAVHTMFCRPSPLQVGSQQLHILH